MMKQEKVTISQARRVGFRTALARHRCHIRRAYLDVKNGRSFRRRENAEFIAKCEERFEVYLDDLEEHLYLNASNGDTASIIRALETHGASRGYGKGGVRQ